MNSSKQKYSLTTRLYSVFFIVLGITIILSFRMGDFFTGSFREFYFSYVANLVVPFGMYFVLCILEIPFTFLRRWYTKTILVILVASIAEFLQGAGLPILAMMPYDLLDLYMIIMGTILAANVDIVLFKRWIPYWNYYGKTTSRTAKDVKI